MNDADGAEAAGARRVGPGSRRVRDRPRGDRRDRRADRGRHRAGRADALAAWTERHRPGREPVATARSFSRTDRFGRMPLPIIGTLVLVLAVAAAVDLRVRRIPNLVSGPAMVAGLVLNTLYFGADGLGASVAGLVVAGAVLLAPFALGGIGGGDVKLMGAVGALLGPRLALWGMALGMMLGGVVVAVHAARRGRLEETVARLGTMVAAATLTRSLVPLRVSAADPRAIALPYSVPLGLGTLAAVALREAGRLPR